jgi:hypothetical protein
LGLFEEEVPEVGEGCMPGAAGGVCTVSTASAAGSVTAESRFSPVGRSRSIGVSDEVEIPNGAPEATGEGAFGENTRIEAPMTIKRKTPTETATSMIFFFSIAILPSPPEKEFQ